MIYNIRKELRYISSTGPIKQSHWSIKTTYIDSSGLGMPLILKEHAESLGGVVLLLAKPKPNVKKLLAVPNFQQLFTIIHYHFIPNTRMPKA